MANEHPNTFHLIIASVGEQRFDGAVLSATFPGTSGVFTILPHHESFVSTLKEGNIRVRTTIDGDKDFAIAGGVIEFSENRAVVLL